MHGAPFQFGEDMIDLTQWLVQQGLGDISRRALLEEYCDRLVVSGVPLLRMHLTQSAIHPKYGGLGFRWQRNELTFDELYARRTDPAPPWRVSPFFHMLSAGKQEIRADLTDLETVARFPIFGDLRALGGVDYFATSVLLETLPDGAIIDPNRPPHGILASWTTDAADGFSPEHVAMFRTHRLYLGLALKAAGNRRTAEDLLAVYVGKGPGQRVMSGEITRGSLERIGAAIMLFDLSDFTRLTETHAPDEIIAMLNGYFGLVEPIVAAHGGIVLKFLGDGLLAIFDCGDDRSDANAALDAALALNQALDAFSEHRKNQGLPAPGFTLALHHGDVLYGNIGSEDRLDFTVIGTAVNMTGRLSGMHRAVGQNILVTEAIQKAASPNREELVRLGKYMLRGIPDPQHLFTIHSGDA